MPRFNFPHTSDKVIGTIDYDRNRSAKLPIPIGHKYLRFDGRLTVELSHAGAAAADMVQEGLLALIDKMFIQVNGGDERYITDGRHIFSQSFKQMGQEPHGFVVPALNGAGTYQVSFQYRFDPTNVVERNRFALDLLNEVNNPDAITTANLEVRWGAIESIFGTVGGMDVVNARLDIEAIEDKLVSDHFRSAELITRRMEFDGHTAAGDIEREIIRVENSQLVSLAIVQTDNGKRLDFSNDDKRVVLRDDEYKWIDRAIWRQRQHMTLLRNEAVPGNMIFLDLTEQATISRALHDVLFSEKLKLKVPADVGTAGQTGSAITVYAEYAKGARLS